jgi:Gamma-glutamyl phosphate reductase
MNLIGIKSRKAAEKKINTYTKNKVLNTYALLIDKEKKSILRQNKKDIKFAESKKLKQNLINRLYINELKLRDIRDSIKKISKLKDPVNVTLKKWSRPNGLNIKKVSIPIGVIGVIYESRPNVTSDVAGLCF